MKQVDFYLISNQVTDAKFKLASRLSNKLQRLRQRALIVTDDQASSQQLDEVMWTFSDTSFVAHDCIGPDGVSAGGRTADSAIHIAEAGQLDSSTISAKYDVLINLCAGIPVINHHFARIAEIVEANQDAKAQARLRYKNYQQEGCELKTHQIEL